jgi:hypothetical protein
MSSYLPGNHSRAQWMRIDTAQILKRFFFCERALIINQAGWLAGIASFDIKTTLPKFFWEDALTAHGLRERVFELRYPSRLMEIGEDRPLIEVFEEAIHAPSAAAFLLSQARVFIPALLAAYKEYLNLADELADGPTIRLLKIAVIEKAEQIALLTRFSEKMLRDEPHLREPAEEWVSAHSLALGKVGGVSLTIPERHPEPLSLPGKSEYHLAEKPARDTAFHLCRYYWPDVIIPDFPYGEGIRLQLRSAISHFNEVWAVETGGAILQAFAKDLPWDFIYDAARWTYDEARHSRMGYDRLRSWGFEKNELPLGSYIYDSAKGQDPLIRLGMLHYFETKNISKKTGRAKKFASYEDKMSQHDMDFDWADETIHAHYGKHWHEALQEKFPDRVPEIETVRRLCDKLVADVVDDATEEERKEIVQIANNLIEKAERLASINN